jgi:SAM-dependent methyltransferase
MGRPFYSAPGLHVEVYDEYTRAHGGAGVAADVAFYTRHAQQFGDPVLELGAGTGRIAWALAQAGDAVVGLDISAAMLARAEARRDTMPPAVQQLARFVRGDMTGFELDETFPCVIIPFRAFQSLPTPEQQRRSLLCIRRHMRPGGRLIIDLFDPWLDRCAPNARIEADVSAVRHPERGTLVKIELVRHDNDPVRQVLTELWRFTELDDAGSVLREEEETLALRWTYRQEMRYLFELTGFEVEAEYSDYQQAAPTYGREQIYIARRR